MSAMVRGRSGRGGGFKRLRGGGGRGYRAYSGILAAEACIGLLVRLAGRASGSVLRLRQARDSELLTGTRAAAVPYEGQSSTALVFNPAKMRY